MTTLGPDVSNVRVSFGDVLRRSKALAKPYRQLLLIAAVPTVIAAVTDVAFALVAAPKVFAGLYSGTFAALFVIAPSIWVGGRTIGGVVSSQAGAVVAVQAAAKAAGRDLSVSAALRESRGVWLRVLPAWVFLGAVQWSASAAVAWTFESARRANQAPEEYAYAFVLLLFALAAANVLVQVAAWVLKVRLFLFMPVTTFDGLEALPALRRSWQLTRGMGGTIFTVVFLAALTGFSDLTALPLLTGVSSDLLNPQLFVVMAVAVLVNQTIQLFVTPALWLISTVIYRWRTGRERIPAPPPPGGWVQPTPPTAWPPPPPTSWPPVA